MHELPRRGKRPHLRERLLRKNQTEHERLLWFLLRSRRFAGFKFRRQHRLGDAIVDFVCLEEKLIVELDGGQHNDKPSSDQVRDQQLSQMGYRVLRFWNPELMQRREDVLDQIWRACSERAAAP